MRLTDLLLLFVLAGTSAGCLRARAEGKGFVDDLAPLARQIEARLLADQTPAGYWAADFTSAPTFTQPTSEQNLFVPCIVASLLQGMPASEALQAASRRATLALAQEADSNGLVSYYGRPVLITPDADDTALVWTVADAEHSPRWPGAVSVLRAHRSSEGFYRTWLAAETKFQAVNTGHDPNPTDIGIQLDILMFLARADRAAAAELFSALKGKLGFDSLWVYYRMTPLLPILRAADLSRIGYELRIPPAWQRARVIGQEDWVRTCLLIGGLDRSGSDRGERTEAADLLVKLARDIPGHPPLFYHNDLSASVSRYYWSRDFGYALWLKLYTEVRAEPSKAAGSGR